MGKIKHTILSKWDRPVTESKPPSFRRQKRASMRGSQDRRGKFKQEIHPVVILKLNKSSQFNETVVHKHSTTKKDVTSNRKVKQMIVSAYDAAGVRELEQMAKDGKGTIKRLNRRVVWHDTSKQMKKPEREVASAWVKIALGIVV
jgi:hypothetical protein